MNVDHVAKRHFILNQQISAALRKLDFKGALDRMAQRDAVALQLFQKGWNTFDLGANALGIEKKHFQELVAQGTYMLGLGCPELPLEQRAIEVGPTAFTRSWRCAK